MSDGWYKVEIIHTYIIRADSEADAIVGHIYWPRYELGFEYLYSHHFSKR